MTTRTCLLLDSTTNTGMGGTDENFVGVQRVNDETNRSVSTSDIQFKKTINVQEDKV